jgi:antirestriction protein ArdC
MGAPDLSNPIPNSQSRTFGHVRRDRNRVRIMPYLATWLTVLKDDKRAIFTAATHA